MIFLAIGLPILFFSFIESTILGAPLTLLVVLSWATYTTDRRSFFMAFLSGLMIDLVTLRPLGETSLVFLVMTFFIFLYGRKFTPSNLIFYTPLCLIATVIYQYLFYLGLNPLFFILTLFLSLIIRFYVRYMFLKFVPQQMSLEL